MTNRSSAPKRVPSRTPKPTIEAIEKLRRLRMTAAEIAEILGMALSTVSRWLKRIGLGKRSRLAPPEPPNRYERSRPGGTRPRRRQEARPDLEEGVRVIASRVTEPVSSRSAPGGWARPAGSSATSASTTPLRLAYAEVLPGEGARPLPASFAGRRPGLRRWE